MRVRTPCACLLVMCLLAGCARTGWRQLLQSENPLERIEGAVAAGRAGDPAAASALVDRLEDDDPAVRMYAAMALAQIEGTTLGYKYWADPVDRARGAQRWRDHLRNRYGGRTDEPIALDRSDAGRAAATAPATQSHPAQPNAPAAASTRPARLRATHSQGAQESGP